MADSIAIYVHIPFCVKKCPYCAFASDKIHAANEPQRVVDGILREAEFRSTQSAWAGKPVHSLFFGGGTPSILTGPQMRDLCLGLRSLFPFLDSAECTLEVNPGTVDESKIFGWQQGGLNRVSIGVQSLEPETLKRLGRLHSGDEARSAFQLIRQAGYKRINADLIYGVHVPPRIAGSVRPLAQAGPDPWHLSTWRNTLEGVLEWKPDHISAYGLTIEEETPFWRAVEKGQRIKVDDTTELAQYELTMDLLERNGYDHYEVSNWSKGESEQCRHNLTYWNGGSYLPLGPSAHGFEAARSRRFWNHRNTWTWLEKVNQNGIGEEDCEYLTPSQRFEEGVMLGLRMVHGITEAELATLAETAQQDWPPRGMQRLIDNGFLLREGDTLRYTRKGLVIADVIEAHLTSAA